MNQEENREEPSRMAKGHNVLNVGAGRECQKSNHNAHEDSSEVCERVQEMAYTKNSTSALNSASAIKASTTNETSGDHLLMNEFAGPAKRLFEQNPSRGPAATPSSASKEDMEVEEINAGGSQDSDNSSSNDHRKINFEATRPSHARMERRSSKRQRSAAGSHRYSPGEGGGLASKKPRANGNSGGGDGDGPARVGNASGRDVTAKTQPGLSSSASSDGDDGRKDKDNKSRRGKGGNIEGGDSKQNLLPPEQWTEPAYRWIDGGASSDRVVDHEGVEIDFANTKTSDWTPPPPFAVRRGDVVLLSSGGVPWDASARRQRNDVQDVGKNEAGREVVPIYEDPASREAGLGTLDPYIGLVERLWEEAHADDPAKKGSSQRKKKGKNANAAVAKSSSSKASRMMIRTRWFFKKENVESLKGTFVVEGGTQSMGNSKREIMGTMASRDLVLTDQSDNNFISTVLGKIKVVKRRPLDWPSSDGVETSKNSRLGAYVCRYHLSFCPVKPSGGKESMMVKLFPCADEADNRDASFQVIAGGIGLAQGEAKDGKSSDRPNASASSDGCASTSGGNGDDRAAPASLPSQLSPRRGPLVSSEGTTTVGKIKIGPNHQATIPVQLDLARKTSFRGLANPPSQRIPTMVWDPTADEGDSVDEFLDDARSLLLRHLRTIGLHSFHDANCIESPNARVEAEKPREMDVDRLLTELHECKGNVRRAVKKVSNNPERYMMVWTQEDKDRFDAGYRTYRESIRMIAVSLGKSKTCKDTVDYHYRFKLVENFRRFQRKKREKAEEIVANVEDRMLNEKTRAEERKSKAGSTPENGTDASSSEEEEAKAIPTKTGGHIDGGGGSRLAAVPASSYAGPVNGRVREWFRTGGNGGEDAAGAAQRRRNSARDLLTQVRERAGGEAYTTLARSLVACNSRAATDESLQEVKVAAREVMRGHPDLLERFVAFLPKEIRSV